MFFIAKNSLLVQFDVIFVFKIIHNKKKKKLKKIYLIPSEFTTKLETSSDFPLKELFKSFAAL